MVVLALLFSWQGVGRGFWLGLSIVHGLGLLMQWEISNCCYVKVDTVLRSNSTKNFNEYNSSKT